MSKLPNSVAKFFWGDNLNDLSWAKHSRYITQKLLDIGDSPAISWLFKKTGKANIKQNLKSYKLSKKSANFWKLYLS